MCHMVMQYLTFGRTARLFSKMHALFLQSHQQEWDSNFSTSVPQGFQFLHISTKTFCFLSFLVIAISVDMKRNLTVIFMSICVVINNTGLFFVYLHWSNLCLNPLFKKGFIFYLKIIILFIILCLKKAHSSLYYCVVKVFRYPVFKSLMRSTFKYFLPLYKFSFYFLDGIICENNVFVHIYEIVA